MPKCISSRSSSVFPCDKNEVALKLHSRISFTLSARAWWRRCVFLVSFSKAPNSIRPSDSFFFNNGLLLSDNYPLSTHKTMQYSGIYLWTSCMCKINIRGILTENV